MPRQFVAIDSDEPQSDLLLRLLECDTEGPWALSPADPRWLQLDKPHVALAIGLADGSSAAMVNQFLSGMLLERPTLVGRDEGHLLALLSATGALSDPGQRRFMLRRVHEALEVANGNIALGWSCMHTGLRGCRRALDEAGQALSMVVRVMGPGNAGGYAEVSVLSLVLRAHGSGHVRLLQERLLGPLLCHDQADGAELVSTLETYLDTACNASRTAELLRVHRNSVAYRLQRIRELADIDLDDPDMRLLVQLTLRSARRFAHQTQTGVSALSLCR